MYQKSVSISQSSVPQTGSPGPRVLVATLLRGSGGTGVETHTAEAVDQLRRAGMQADVVTSWSRARLLAMLLFAPRVVLDLICPAAAVAWYRWSHAVALSRALSRELRNEPDAVVYAQCPVSAQAALRVRRSRQQSVVLAVHINLSQADEWASKERIPWGGRTFRAIRRLEEEVFTSVDGLVYVSDAVRADVASHIEGIDRVPGAVLPNFVRDGVQHRDPRLAAPADLVTVGTLEPRKNHRFLLEVLAEAAARGRRYTLDVIGDGPCRKDLIRLAEELGVSGQVRFLGARTDVRALLPGYRLYVHAARQEAFGICLIEAMSAGLPVVAGPVGGVPEVLDRGRAGTFWSLDDPTEAARTLIRLLEDPDWLTESARVARAHFLASYSADEVGAELARLLASSPASWPARVVAGTG